MIEEVEEVGPKLHPHLFSDLRILGDGKIEIGIVRAIEFVPSQVAEVLGAGNACTGSGVEGARDGKCRSVEESCWLAGAGEWVAHQIGAAKEFAGAVVIILKQPVDVHRLAAAGGQNTV